MQSLLLSWLSLFRHYFDYHHLQYYIIHTCYLLSVYLKCYCVLASSCPVFLLKYLLYNQKQNISALLKHYMVLPKLGSCLASCPFLNGRGYCLSEFNACNNHNYMLKFKFRAKFQIVPTSQTFLYVCTLLRPLSCASFLHSSNHFSNNGLGHAFAGRFLFWMVCAADAICRFF